MDPSKLHKGENIRSCQAKKKLIHSKCFEGIAIKSL
jgi:hypothetical protein